jgi:hypothetical protein
MSGNHSFFRFVLGEIIKTVNMKKYYLHQLLLVGLLFLTHQVNAQIPAIDSMKVIPANPDSVDEIKVICYTTFPYGDCDLIDHSFTIEDNTITLSLNYTMGMAAYICHSVDTISLGYLNAGNYNLEANLTIDPEEVIEDMHSISFFVDEHLGINKIAHDILIYPNPFQDKLSIKTDGGVEQLEIFSIFGQKVISKNNLLSELTVNVSDLEDGIYLVILTDNKGNRYSNKVLKTKL